MKKLYGILKTALWCVVGVFLGTSIYQCWDYHAHPGLYQLNSAPWYLSILVSGAFTAVIAAVLLIVMYAINKR